LKSALRTDRAIITPRIVAPSAFGGETLSGIPIAAGAGDNAGAALGVQAQPGDVVVSLGTSGTAFAVSDTPTHDASGAVAGFADATGRFLPLVCTLNAARILDAATRILGKTHDEVGALALSAKPGANGLSLLPYFEGERTPNRPDATGVFAGMNLSNSNPADIARAMIEGMLCGLVDAVDALEQLGVSINRVLLLQFHLLHHHSLVVKYLCHNLANMLLMVLPDKLRGRSWVELLRHNGIWVKLHLLTHRQRQML
jgi:xylulokinase